MNSIKDQKRVVQVDEKVDETPITTFGGGDIHLRSKVSNSVKPRYAQGPLTISNLEKAT
jgi:hypothetical protein